MTVRVRGSAVRRRERVAVVVAGLVVVFDLKAAIRRIRRRECGDAPFCVIAVAYAGAGCAADGEIVANWARVGVDETRQGVGLARRVAETQRGEDFVDEDAVRGVRELPGVAGGVDSIRDVSEGI